MNAQQLRTHQTHYWDRRESIPAPNRCRDCAGTGYSDIAEIIPRVTCLVCDGTGRQPAGNLSPAPVAARVDDAGEMRIAAQVLRGKVARLQTFTRARPAAYHNAIRYVLVAARELENAADEVEARQEAL